MAEFDPGTANVDEVLKKLEKADEQERQRILAAEKKGKARSTVLNAYGMDPDERTDAHGRTLYPWEVEAKDEVRPVQVRETAQARRAREAQAEFDAKVEKAAPSLDEQKGGTPAGVGTPAAGVADTAGV